VIGRKLIEKIIFNRVDYTDQSSACGLLIFQYFEKEPKTFQNNLTVKEMSGNVNLYCNVLVKRYSKIEIRSMCLALYH